MVKITKKDLEEQIVKLNKENISLKSKLTKMTKKAEKFEREIEDIKIKYPNLGKTGKKNLPMKQKVNTLQTIQNKVKKTVNMLLQ